MDHATDLGPSLCELSRYLSNHDSGLASAACEALLIASQQSQPQFIDSNTNVPDLKILLEQPESLDLKEFESVFNCLPWSQSKTRASFYPGVEGLATIELLGSTGVFENDDLRIGLVYLPEHTYYPNHRHAAEELYLVLAGNAKWGQSKNTATIEPPGAFRFHESWEWHEMITGDMPMLSLYCWSGDLRFDQYEFESEKAN